MTNSIDEVEHYDVLFIIGSNTTEAHPDHRREDEAGGEPRSPS